MEKVIITVIISMQEERSSYLEFISNARIIAKNTFQALITLDKTNENYYLHRYDSLCKVINRTDSVINNIFQTRKADHAFMIYHPALSYFARDYGLHQICIEEEGKEPSPAHLRDLIEICKEEEVNYICTARV